MTAIRRSLAVAALALSAAPALAHEQGPMPYPPAPPPYVEPAPAYAPPPAYPAPPVELRPAEWAPRWGWQIRTLQADYGRLERDRARFYATWRGNPWAQRRFETWYAVRRTELDRRQAWLAERREHRAFGHVAWGGEREGRGPGGWRGDRDRDDD